MAKTCGPPWPGATGVAWASRTDVESPNYPVTGAVNLTSSPVSSSIPSRKFTYPTWGKGKSSSKCHFLGDMLVSWRVSNLKPWIFSLVCELRRVETCLFIGEQDSPTSRSKWQIYLASWKIHMFSQRKNICKSWILRLAMLNNGCVGLMMYTKWGCLSESMWLIVTFTWRMDRDAIISNNYPLLT